MTIEEMQELRRTMESLLAAAASDIVREFQSRTRLRVEHVSIDLIDDTSIGMRPTSMVVGARLSIEL